MVALESPPSDPSFGRGWPWLVSPVPDRTSILSTRFAASKEANLDNGQFRLVTRAEIQLAMASIVVKGTF